MEVLKDRQFFSCTSLCKILTLPMLVSTGNTLILQKSLHRHLTTTIKEKQFFFQRRSFPSAKFVYPEKGGVSVEQWIILLPHFVANCFAAKRSQLVLFDLNTSHKLIKRNTWIIIYIFYIKLSSFSKYEFWTQRRKLYFC
jgi:hypothetical protein